MVEQIQSNSDVQVRFSLDLHHLGKKKIYKKVFSAIELNNLLQEAKQLGAPHQITEADWLRYHDGQDWINIEDANDLTLALNLAKQSQERSASFKPQKGNKPAQIVLTILPSGQSDAPIKQKQPRKVRDENLPETNARKYRPMYQGVPRKFLKLQIMKFLGRSEAEMTFVTPGEKAKKAERKPKLQRNAITDNGEPQNTAEQTPHKGGKKNRGAHGACSQTGPKQEGLKQLIDELVSKFSNDEEIKAKFDSFRAEWNSIKDERANTDKNVRSRNDWREARAVCTRKPEEVISIAKDSSAIAQIEVLNDTYWPWKFNCTVTPCDKQDQSELPVDVFSVPVEQSVMGKASCTLQIPLKVASHVNADADKVYTIMMTLREPYGQAFGQPIPVRVRVV